MNFEELKTDFANLEIPFDNIENVTVRDVIKAYKRQALKVHPDKQGQDITEEEKTKFKELFQELNKSYERILKIVVNNIRQAGAELVQAQLKPGLDFNQI